MSSHSSFSKFLMLTKFTFGTIRIRVVTVENDPWFVLADVCNVLGLVPNGRNRSYQDHTRKLAADERSTITLSEGKRGSPSKTVVSESGLFKLIIRSNKPEARVFQDWVTREVLPAIRRLSAP